MAIPAAITILVERLNQEINQIEKEAIEALKLVKISLKRFPNNFTLIQLDAFLNTSLFFVANSRQKIKQNIDYFFSVDVMTEKRIQEVGEDLAIELGRVLETKLTVSNIKTRLENL